MGKDFHYEGSAIGRFLRIAPSAPEPWSGRALRLGGYGRCLGVGACGNRKRAVG